MANSDPGEVRDSGDAEDLGQPVLSPEVAAALKAEAEQQESAQLLDQARKLGLLADDETVTPEEVRQRIEEHQEKLAEQARAAIAGTGEAEDTADLKTGARSERGPRRRDKQGRFIYESRYSPGEDMPRLRPSDKQLIDETVDWYANQFTWDELTAEQALALLRDARDQGLYRWDNNTRERTPIQVADDAIRRKVVDLFGEGTDNEGLGERRLRELRAAEPQVRQGRTFGAPAGAGDTGTERRHWDDEELEVMLGALERQITDLSREDPDLAEKWKEILDAFFQEQVLYYDDQSNTVSNVEDKNLRKRAWDLFNQAKDNYNEAVRKRKTSASVQDNEGEPSPLTLEEIRSRIDALEGRINELSNDDEATWEQWRGILDDFIRQRVVTYDDTAPGDARGRAVSTARKPEVRDRALELYNRAKAKLVEAERRAGFATSGKEASEHAEQARRQVRAVRRAARLDVPLPYDLDDDFDQQMAKRAMNRDADDPSGLLAEERERYRANQGSLEHRAEPAQVASEQQLAAEPQVAQPGMVEPQDTPGYGEMDQDTVGPGGSNNEQEPTEDPLVTRAVEKVRREWQRAIDLERDQAQRQRMESMMRDEMNFERRRVTQELRLEAERERRGRMGR